MATPHGKPELFPAGLTEVGPGCHAWLQPNGGWFESNAGLVVGDGESLLVDTLADLALTRRMLGAMAQPTAAAPIRTLVNTHSDVDHVAGNQLVEGAEIVSSRRSAALMREQNPGSLEGFRKLAQAMRAVGRLPLPVVGSLPLPRVPRVRLRTIGDYLVDMLAPFEFGGIEVTPPAREFEGVESLSVGGRKVRLIEVGPAHTPGDLMVHVPDAGVVYTGDILFAGVTPIMWAGPVANWIAALDTLLELDAGTYVPGHGPVCGRDEAEALKRYWTWLEAAARHRFGLGMSPWQAARDILLAPDFRTHEWSRWLGPERILVNLVTLDKERRGQLGGEASPRELIATFSRVALLASELKCV
jgi:glyoxylase-like metal-dependent hydrolase (beta-lactamase superfamily II)